MAHLWRKIIDLLYPPTCVRCGELLGKGDAFCDSCLEDYIDAKDRTCPICLEKVSNCTCPGNLLKAGAVKQLYKLFYYFPNKTESAHNQIIYALKRKHLHYAYEFLAQELACVVLNHLGDELNEYTLTYIPASYRRMGSEGYDHMQYFAKYLSYVLHIPYENTLIYARKKKKAQKFLSKQERIKSANGLFLPSNKVHIIDKKYILLDDVVTTGATLLAGATALRRGGAKSVKCAVIASKPPRIKKKYHIKKQRLAR